MKQHHLIERLALVLVGLILGAVGAAHAADYYVAEGATGNYTAGNPGPFPWEAADLATQSGDVIHVGAGHYSYETGNITVKNGVTMIGATDNPADTVIERLRVGGGNNNRVIRLGNQAVLRNVTIRGGYTDYQAACILGYDGKVHKIFSVSNCIVENGSANHKGGASFGGVWYDCVLRNNTVRNPSGSDEAQEGSGGAVFGGTLYNCVVTNNTAFFMGGGLGGSTTDPCTAYGCTIANNTAPFGAGAGTNFRPDDCRLYNCTVVSNDGHNVNSQSWGACGGGTYNCWVTNSLIAWNTVQMDNTSGTDCGGGGVYYGKVIGTTIRGNKTLNAGNWNIDGAGARSAYLENCDILENYSERYAGGTRSCTNINCRIVGNNGTGGGGTFGGINYDCVISNNTARGIQGGASYNSTSYNCLVVGNKTTASYGTLCRGYHQGCLVVSNEVNSSIAGASGICAADGGTDCTVVNCTVADNRGGDVGVTRASVTNSIVAGHAKDVENLSVVSHSCWMVGTAPAATPGCLDGMDPKFAKEGPGVIEYYALRGSSPCREKGIEFAWMAEATDLAGNQRVKYGNVDFGALEFCGSLRTVILFR